MKSLNVKKIAVDAAALQAADIPALFDREGIAAQAIDTVNWSEYPYCPNVSFCIAHTGSHILLHFQVCEESVRSVAGQDNGRVWEDACVEFFSSPADDGTYYNMECNCTARLLVGGGGMRPDRRHATQEILDGVKRWASLGGEDFEERIGPCSWEVALAIPCTTYFLHDVPSLDGRDMRANFYKCGDKLKTPHFLSWNPIELPQPAFHAPQFFGMLHFE